MPDVKPCDVKPCDVKPCAFCGNKIGLSGQSDFFVISMHRYFLDIKEINRHNAIEQLFGGGPQGAMLACVMGTQPDIAQQVDERIEAWVCASCCYIKSVMLFDLLQNNPDQTDDGQGIESQA